MLFYPKQLLKKALPERTLTHLRRLHGERLRSRIASLPPIAEKMFSNILANDLELRHGDMVLIHSSLDHLHLAFPFYRVLYLIREIIGSRGTMLFVTYPRQPSYDFLRSGENFDIRNTPSYTGILSEFARKQKSAIRSLHPTKSVCAIGEYAKELVKTHQASPYPFDFCSPYHKMVDYDAKVIGLGVSTRFLSFVHCIDDALKENFAIQPYHKQLFSAKCINYENKTEVVNTYAHNMLKMNHDIPFFMQRYISPDICRDIKIKGMEFFIAKVRNLFPAMIALAENNITIYRKSSYKRNLLG